MKKTGLMIAMIAGLSLAGCGGYVAYAAVPPPPLRVETYGPAPGPGYVYVNGYWGYRGNGYYWAPGAWRLPPRGARVWVAGRWESRGGRYYYTRGRWR
jgi:hypothetical protein